MADVTFPLSFEDLDSLLANEQLPSELAAVFEDLLFSGVSVLKVRSVEVGQAE
jgi:hypothetical protein